MAKSKETFNKKQKETKRLKQLQDKKQRLEERKATKKKGGNLEDMMAYLDENGNLTDTPPDPTRRRQEIRAEDIEIGVPKYEREAEVPRNGTVSFFNGAKGFGFINDSVGGERIFFHVSDLLEPVEEGNRVEFSVGHGPRGANAIQVKKKVN